MKLIEAKGCIIYIYINKLIVVAKEDKPLAKFVIDDKDVNIRSCKDMKYIADLHERIATFNVKGDSNDVVLDRTAFVECSGQKDLISIINKGRNNIYLSNFFDRDISLLISNKGGHISSKYKSIWCKELYLECKADYDNTSSIIDLIVTARVEIVCAYNGYIEMSIFPRCSVVNCKDALTGMGFMNKIDRQVKDIDKTKCYDIIVDLYRRAFDLCTSNTTTSKKVSYNGIEYDMRDLFKQHFNNKCYDRWIC
jgi:hypothetical protein